MVPKILIRVVKREENLEWGEFRVWAEYPWGKYYLWYLVSLSVK